MFERVQRPNTVNCQHPGNLNKIVFITTEGKPEPMREKERGRVTDIEPLKIRLELKIEANGEQLKLRVFGAVGVYLGALNYGIMKVLKRR